jgi:hypothetical protein
MSKSEARQNFRVSSLCEITSVILLKSLKKKVRQPESEEKARFPQWFIKSYQRLKASEEVRQPRIYKEIVFPYFTFLPSFPE